MFAQIETVGPIGVPRQRGTQIRVCIGKGHVAAADVQHSALRAALGEQRSSIGQLNGHYLLIEAGRGAQHFANAHSRGYQAPWSPRNRALLG